MAIEAGAMNGIIAADKTTETFLNSIGKKSLEIFHSDDDA